MSPGMNLFLCWR